MRSHGGASLVKKIVFAKKKLLVFQNFGKVTRLLNGTIGLSISGSLEKNVGFTGNKVSGIAGFENSAFDQTRF